MARMYSNVESPRAYFGDILQLTNWILYSSATCHMPLEISYLLPVSLVETDKCIKPEYGNVFTVKKTRKDQINMCGDNSKPFIAKLYNVLFHP